MKLPLPYCIAHRGARAHAPENTLAAARLGHAAGAWMWELDTRYTKDMQLVVFHDDTLERTTNIARHPEFGERAPWKAGDFTLAELRSLDAGSFFMEQDPYGTLAAGELTPAQTKAWRGEKIPTLEEALSLTRELDWRVNVEIKDHAGLKGHDSIARDVCALIHRMGMTERVILSSFQHAYLVQAADYRPEIPRAALRTEPCPDDALALCQAAHSVYYHPKRTILREQDVEKLREAGVLVNVWTVNQPDEMEKLIRLGVNGIITDYPERLCARLRT